MIKRYEPMGDGHNGADLVPDGKGSAVLFTDHEQKIKTLKDKVSRLENGAKYQPSIKDIDLMCDALEESWSEDSQSCDRCNFCGHPYGNAYKNYIDKGKKLPHSPDCITLVAQDVSTGILQALTELQGNSDNE